MTQVLGEMSALRKVSLRLEVAGGDVHAGLGEPAGERRAVDEEFDLEAGQQDLVENLDDQLVLADGETPHRRARPGGSAADGGTIGGKNNYTPVGRAVVRPLLLWPHVARPGVACAAMTRYWCLSAAILLGAAAAPVSAAPPAVDSPEPVIRAFYRALLKGDAAGYHAAIVEDPRAERFLMKEPPDADKAREVDMESQTFTMRQLQPFRLKGKETTPADGKYPVGTTTRYLANFPSSLTVISVVRAADGWKVDMRWWDAIADLMQKDVENGTPDTP